MLEVRDLSFRYGDDVAVLSDLSLNIAKGEVVSLLGPSGCGKSTVLRIIAKLLTANEGDVIWQGAPELAFVFQDPALMPWATVGENVRLPGRLKGSVDQKSIEHALDSVGLGAMTQRFPAQLSGGQRMRASVARALAANPTVLLMDEPFAALDEILRFQMNELLLDLRAERGLSILFVTHSLYEAAYLSDRVLVMDSGQINGEVKPDLNRENSAQDQRASVAFTSAVSKISALMARPGQ